MINKHELVFAVDENNNPVEPVERQKAHTEGFWHRTNDIVVVNSKKEILCSKRSMFKDTSPGSWDASFGGHVLAGTDDISSALQELKEESGLDANEQDLEFVGIVRHIDFNGKNKEFRYCYIFNWNGSPSDLQLEKEEIDEVKWVPIEIVEKNRQNWPEWSPMPYFDMLFEKLQS